MVGVRLNVAVTVSASVISTSQVVLMPEHAPPQPPNVWPDEGVAVSVTAVEAAKIALQVAPMPVQLNPDGLELTVAFPVPSRFTIHV